MSEYLAQLQALLFSEDESNLELALELVKTLEIDAWPLYSDLQKCSEFFSEKFRISPNVRALLRYLHQHKGQLNFSNRQLQHLPSYLSALGELVTRVDLSYNQFSQLPDCIAHFDRLKSLYFSETAISELPRWVFELQQLEELEFRNTLVYEIPDQISHLSQLSLLVAGNSPGAGLKISPNLAKMKNLAAVHFYLHTDCKVQTIDKQLFNMPYLKALLLSAPNLQNLPQQMNLPQLQTLNFLYMRPPTHLAALASQLPQLRTLAIAHYQPFDYAILAPFTRLETLQISRQMSPYLSQIRQLLPDTYIDFSTYY